MTSESAVSEEYFEYQEFLDDLYANRKLRPHSDLVSWKRAVGFVKKLCNLTESFPKDERFGLSSQLRRSGVSVALNIAEGSARKGNKDNCRFLNIADASLGEIETCLILSLELKYINQEKFVDL